MKSSGQLAFLRILSIAILVLTACLVGLDSQTKVVFLTLRRKASYKDVNALYALVWIDTAAAAYNLLQLFTQYMLLSPRFKRELLSSASSRYLAWGVYLLDQAAVYVVFAGTAAATEASILAVTGEESFQWMKVCDKYRRFCMQIGGALLTGYVAVILMIIISCISAHALFRLYSPNNFLVLKATSSS